MAQGFGFSYVLVLQRYYRKNHYTLGSHKHDFMYQAKKRQRLQYSIEYDNTSHEGGLFPPPVVFGWVAVVAWVSPFGDSFEPRAPEPGSS